MTVSIQEKATIQAVGEHTNGNTKRVICIETGHVFTSAIDASDYAGVRPSTMSIHLNGKTKTCNGKHYCFLSKLNEGIDAIATRLRDAVVMEEKARQYDVIMAEREEERRRKQAIEEKRQEIVNLEKALVIARYQLSALENGEV